MATVSGEESNATPANQGRPPTAIPDGKEENWESRSACPPGLASQSGERVLITPSMGMRRQKTFPPRFSVAFIPVLWAQSLAITYPGSLGVSGKRTESTSWQQWPTMVCQRGILHVPDQRVQAQTFQLQFRR